jgi:hypothetical protein
MTFLCIRVDLDYVPWDTPDAAEFGHGEPAMLLRLLEWSRHSGARIHFFASNRVIRAFPATAETVLDEGHDLDWLCKHIDRFDEAKALFEDAGNPLQGLAVRTAWPPEVPPPPLRFLSASPGRVQEGIRLFPVETKSDRDASRGGLSARGWTEGIKGQVRDAASRNRGLTLSLRPQVLAKFDPKLQLMQEIFSLAHAVGLPNRTLRQLI